MEVGDKVIYFHKCPHGNAEAIWQFHTDWWIFRFGIVIGYPRVFTLVDIDRFGSTKARSDEGLWIEALNTDYFKPHRWWDYLKWR